MKFAEPTRNPMGDILELFSYEWDYLTPSILENFRILMIDAGFISENVSETSRSLDILEELKLIEIKEEDNQYKVRKVKYG
jgi:hypothetical protein